MAHYSYLIFLIPILVTDILVLIIWCKTLSKYKKTLTATVIFWSLWYFIFDPLAVSRWHIWSYGRDKILGIWILGATLEEFIWIVLVAFLFGSLTIIFGRKFGILKNS